MIELVTTDGIFRLDGGEWEVTNNIWLVGDDREVLVIDAAHDHGPIVEAVNGRRVSAIVLTHGHNDHINAARRAAGVVDAPILLHPDDTMLWTTCTPTASPTGRWPTATCCAPAGSRSACCTRRATPRAAAASRCRRRADVFSGDTLFCGGPGATGRSHSDFPTIVASIRARLLTLPAETIVHTGHGDTTTIGAEAPDLEEWLRRGS